MALPDLIGTIDSIMRTEGLDFEVIAVDDAGPDGTLGVLKKQYWCH
jgi:glycosyltransferase involved in cell wall biosynthesis